MNMMDDCSEECETNTKSIFECLNQQILEVELLQSIYADSICIDKDSNIEFLKNLLLETDSDSDDVASGLASTCRIEFTLTLTHNPSVGSQSPVRVELHCSLPQTYPYQLPDIYVKADSLCRKKQSILNKDIMEYLSNLPRGDLVISQLAQWLSDRIYNLLDSDTDTQVEITDNSDRGESKLSKIGFRRLWLYSHHIYSKTKRKDMLDLAKDLGLTGFVMPGKPGVVCIEGVATATEEFWKIVRCWTWKKIVVKHREVYDSGDGDLFTGFEEVSFQPRHGGGKEYHMDMGLFYKYLADHQCGHLFQLYFGVEGKSSTN